MNAQPRTAADRIGRCAEPAILSAAVARFIDANEAGHDLAMLVPNGNENSRRSCEQQLFRAISLVETRNVEQVEPADRQHDLANDPRSLALRGGQGRVTPVLNRLSGQPALA